MLVNNPYTSDIICSSIPLVIQSFYETNTKLTNIFTANPAEEILNQIYAYDRANNITRQNEKTYAYDDTNQLTRCTTQGTFPEKKPTPGYYGRRLGDTAGTATLDFSVGANAIVHLDYNSTSIGLDFGNGPRRIRKIVLIPDEDHATHRITANTLELYTATLYYQYVQIPSASFTFEKDANGVITITLNEVLESRYLKINVLFDERDKTYTPEDRAEFINTLGAMIAVYSEGTSRTEEYEYDKAGNRILERITLVQADDYASMYYENSNRLKTDGKYAFVYDNAGNMVKKGNAFEINGNSVIFTATEGEGVEYWEYTFDLLNRLTEVTKNGTLVAGYIYDALGYRVVKRSNGETTHYVFEGTESIFEKNITTDEIKSYVYALGKHFARVDGVIGDPEVNVYYYHNDHLGSVRAVSDSNGDVVWSADYMAFGGQVDQENQGFNEWHGFTGKAYDTDIGLYYYNARWYDASTGRFISVDPIAAGLNWYIYGNNNPLIMFDPTGLEGEYFQIPYTQKQNYFDVFLGPWWLTPIEAVANIGVFAGNSFIDITNTLTGGVNLLLYAGQNPNWNYELMDAIAYGPGKLSDETIYYFQNTSPEQIIGDLKDSFTDPATYERALANFVIMWVGYKSSVIKNQGNGLEGKQFDFDEVDDFVKESYDDLSAEGKKIVGDVVDAAAGGMKNYVPTVKELRAFNPSGSGLQTHHLLPEYLGKQLGYTPSQMTNQPGILIPQFTHTGALNPVAFHKVISSYLPVGGNYTVAQISQGLSAAYTELGMSELFNTIAPLIK